MVRSSGNRDDPIQNLAVFASNAKGIRTAPTIPNSAISFCVREESIIKPPFTVFKTDEPKTCPASLGRERRVGLQSIFAALAGRRLRGAGDFHSSRSGSRRLFALS